MVNVPLALVVGLTLLQSEANSTPRINLTPDDALSASTHPNDAPTLRSYVGFTVIDILHGRSPKTMVKERPPSTGRPAKRPSAAAPSPPWP
ncbi:hypothetical protein [Paludibacterium purpuratum]|uniref:Uncharacterized protein n=1 Tax=Paludibacterium purpuratum TaxID=1144873 RepID=A0A4R7BCK4_9NEIS|nr:hypothetical protein [Paludibacterium purpuratum]TDR81466.1 hypothetical protein DFP86_103119 [Paludibacterium purpuratum]